MTRVVFNKAEIKDFFNDIKKNSKQTWREIGELVGLSDRTLRAWKNGEYLPNEQKIRRLSKKFKVKLPFIKEKKLEYWSARQYCKKGAFARLKKYGPPGTLKGRRKGGLVVQQRRRENPELYRKIGNLFASPKKSIKLAEFCGLVLGDGSISKGQCFIYLNKDKDCRYFQYVKQLIFELFNYVPGECVRKEYGVVIVIISGINFVELLMSYGLKIGNKTKQQVDVPRWIKNDILFAKWCLRGLMDTDGGVFNHKYKVRNREYNYKKICFVNKSMPLLDFVYQVLKKLDFNPKMAKNRVWLYSEMEVKKYIKIIGSSNQRLLKKFDIINDC